LERGELKRASRTEESESENDAVGRRKHRSSSDADPRIGIGISISGDNNKAVQGCFGRRRRRQ
jgi:hypothetical protein